MTIYFLSGLGADRRAFQYLDFPAGIKTIHIDWLKPHNNEPLYSYAKKIAEKIDTSVPFVLVGLSFGGMLATEVMEFVQPQRTFLISSVARRQELPSLYKLAGLLRLNKMLPAREINKSSPLMYWLFGITKTKDKLLLNDILSATDVHFSKWAIHEIVNWQRTTNPKNIIRIHGDKDRVLPIKNFKPHYVVKDGGHFMVVNKAKEISEILNKEISSI